jgi:hypothetical protein
MAGFEDSDIQEFSRAVRHRIGSETEAVGFATLIAKTTDPRLTESFVISSIEQADTGISAIISKWRMLRPATWPRESTTRFSDGSFGIVLTRISHDGVSIQTATLCSIMIDIEGQILAKSCFTRDMSRQIPQEGGP